MKRGVVIIISAVFLVLLIAVLIFFKSSHKTTNTVTTIKIWSPFDEGDIYQAMLKPTLDVSPNVKVEFTYIKSADAQDYENKVVEGIAAGNGPDIWLARTDWLPKHQTKIIPANGLVALSTNKKQTDEESIEATFGKAVAAQNEIDGKLYGAPLSVDSLALYINTNVLKQMRGEYSNANDDAKVGELGNYPKTWADVQKWAQLLIKKDNKGNLTQYGLALGTVNNTYAPTDVYTSLLQQYGGNLFSDDHRDITLGVANTDNKTTTIPGQEALNLFTSFATPGNANYSWNKDAGDPTDAFVNDKLGMMIGYSTLSKDIFQKDKNFDHLAIVPLPQINDPDITGKQVDYSAYWTHVVSKNSSSPAVAWQVIQALLGQDAINLYAKQTSKPTINQIDVEAKLSYSGADLGETSLFAQEAAHSTIVYTPDWEASDQALEDMINQVNVLKQSVQSSVDSATEALKKLLPAQ